LSAERRMRAKEIKRERRVGMRAIQRAGREEILEKQRRWESVRRE